MLTGQNGILNRAGEAKDETERSQQEELEKLGQQEAIMDKYKYGVTIPDGYTVSTKEGENSLGEGLVITDSSGNEYVWVEVPRASVHDADTTIGYAGYAAYNVDGNLTDTTVIEAGLEAYAAPYTKGSATQDCTDWKDKWYEGCGLTQEEYKRDKEKMLKSIYKNEGFWISRYEIGDEEGTKSDKARTNSNNPLTTPVSKQNQVPYIYVTCSQAQELASKMAQGSTLTSSLLFGIQWDLVCKYLEVKLGSNVTVNEKNIINEDSSTWGNYDDSEIKLNRGKYLKYENNSLGKEWFDYNNKTTGYVEGEINKKVKNKSILLTTGASDDTKKQNIYDLAGNLAEWTLEHALSGNGAYGAYRGGNYNLYGKEVSASSRNNYFASSASSSYRLSCCTLLNVLPSLDSDALKKTVIDIMQHYVNLQQEEIANTNGKNP